ncbi:MAG: alpha/beta fold hydrolase [Pseudobdellovibrionaceae bacterium]
MDKLIRNWSLIAAYGFTRLTQNRLPQVAAVASSFMWFTPFKKQGHRKSQELRQSSKAQVFKSKNKRFILRSWGEQNSGEQIVLVHGWGGRWDQYTEMIQDLVEKGFRVSAFDLPAHGESPGLTTDIFEWAEALEEAGKFLKTEAHYICHSFGFLAVAQAYFNRDLKVKSLIAINSPSRFYFLAEQFMGKLKLNRKVEPYLLQQMRNRVGPHFEQRINVPIRQLHQELPFYFIADTEDKEVPFREHSEIASVLGGHFIVTQGLGHNGILRNKSVHDQISSLVNQSLRPL